MNPVYIVGIGQTRRGYFPEKSWTDLAFDAYSQALADSPIDPADIGHIWLGLYPTTSFYGFTASHPLVDSFGLASKVGCTSVEKACTSGGDALHSAFLGVASGMYDCTVAVASCKLGDSILGGFAGLAEENYMLAQQGIAGGMDRAVEGGGEDYLRKYVTEDDIYALYSTWSYYGSRHPNSMIYGQPGRTREEYDKLPYEAYPFRFGSAGCRFADGASVIVLASEDHARNISDTLVQLAAIVSIDDAFNPTHRIQYNPWEGGIVPAVATAWDRAYKLAGVTATDLDVFQPHDNSPMKSWKHMEMIGHPDLGLGRGPKWYTEGNALPGGKLPAITAGMARGGYVESCVPLDQVIENYRQLTDQAGERQVPIKHGVAAGITSTIRISVQIVKRH